MIMSTTTNDENHDGMGYFESVKKPISNTELSPSVKKSKLLSIISDEKEATLIPL
jgi:hypothetical protein